MNRWEGFTDDEIRYLAAAIGVCYSEGIGDSGNPKSDRRFERDIAEEIRRRGLGSSLSWWLRDER